jgi:hypothetical protein
MEGLLAGEGADSNAKAVVMLNKRAPQDVSRALANDSCRKCERFSTARYT